MSQPHHHYHHQAPAQEHNHPHTETSPLRRTLVSPSCYPSPQHYNHHHSQLLQHPQQQQQLPYHSLQQQQLPQQQQQLPQQQQQLPQQQQQLSQQQQQLPQQQQQLPHHSQQQQQLSQQLQQLSHQPQQQHPQLPHHSQQQQPQLPQQLQKHPHLQHVTANNNNHHSFITPATVHHHHANNPHHPPQVHFPPPPTSSYPPCSSGATAMTSTSPMLDSGSGGSSSVDRVLLPDSSGGGEHHVAAGGPSNIDYSYAYYEPGPPTRHGNVPSCQQQHQDHRARRGQYQSGGCDAAYREGSYRSKHTYLTRYGTEENIYEEISDVARARLLHPAARHQPSLLSLNQSLVDEEVRRVQFGHKRVLDQLNLSVEAMLMPSNSRSSSDDTDRDNEQQDQVTDLHSVGPTDDLLSPVGMAPPHHHHHYHHHHQDMDSGFSGSSSGASYRSVCGSLRRGISLQRPKSGVVMPTTSTSTSLSQSSVAVGFSQSSPSSDRVGAVVSFDTSDQHQSSPNSKSFWSKKAWRKLGFSNTSLNKQQQKDEHRTRRNPLREEPTITSTPSPNTASRRSSTSILHTPKTRLATSSSSQRSSEDSWCSGSEQDITTDEDESDRSVTSSNRSNSHKLRNPFHKAKTLWRSGESPTATTTTNLQMRHSLDNSGIPLEVETAHNAGGCTPLGVNAAQSRLSRWFSIRRGSSHQYDVDSAASGGMMGPEGGGGLQTSSPVKMLTGAGGGKMPELPEVDEDAFPNCTIQQRRHLPPSLPPSPGDLTQQQLKRRMIIAAIVHSENSYVATLQRLVNDYKKPLEESSPPILSNAKISTLFYRLPEILQCHTLFRIALAESVRSWDSDERIGDVFVASFSKAIVLDIYSGFINNFSVAMDMAKMEAKRKSALSDFLKVKQISSHDRLSFFGLMVKPVQRFPQFILFLQDLLKYTPQGHHDRMSLQLALTQLESLAEMLNERKREAEQFQAFKEMLRHITGKFAARPLSDSNRYLLREDNVTQFELNQYGLITKTKSRRLLLLNDLVVCVAVTPKQSDEFASSKRLTLKWMCPVTDIEVQDTSASPTLSRLLIHSNGNKSGSLKSNVSFDGNSQQPQSDNLCTEMSNLMYDYEVISRIQDFVGTLKGSYEHITVDNTRQTLLQIQSSIQQKDAEMLWVDSCCLQLVVTRGGGGVNSNVVGNRTAVKEEVYTFQTDNPDVKKEWMTELRLAQLALDPSNSPAWEIPEQELRPSTKMPLFVKAQPVFNSQHPTDVSCGCYYSLPTTSKSSKYNRRPQSYLWLCTTDGVSSHITILAQNPQHAGTLKTHFSFSLLETQVTCVEFIKTSTQASSSLAANTIWCGTYNRKLLIYTADFLEAEELLSVCSLPDTILHIKYLCDSVFVALANGSLLIFRRSCDGGWSLSGYDSLQLGTDSVSCLLPINSNLYASCGKKVFVISAPRGEITRSFIVQHEHLGNVNLMAHSGIGLWISLKNSSTICLYHTETFKHLQDINVASNVMRVTNTGGSGNDSINNNRSHVNVTALLACKGLLWVGTNVGISLTIPLPRLEGVPIISGRVNISYHAHFGPISFLLALQLTYPPAPPQETTVEDQSKPESTAESSAKLLHHLTKSPLVIRRRKSKERNLSRLSKTLPRGLGNGNASFSTSATSSVFSDTCDVYGLYGKLMYIKDYEHNDSSLLTDPVYESLRRSDPELSTLSGKVSTLDRRLKMKVSRPRSLDLSNWSVDSRTSSVYTSSGGSDDSIAQRLSGKTNSDKLVKPSETESTVKLAVKEEINTRGDGKKKINDTHTVDNNPRRTIITLMGGRGYVNWRQPGCSTEKNKSVAPPREPNSTDAHIVIWELKL